MLMFSKYYMDVVIRSKPLLSESTGVLHNGLTSWQGEKNRTYSNKNKYFILKILLYWVTIGFVFLFKFWLNTWLSMAKNTRMNLNNISFHFISGHDCSQELLINGDQIQCPNEKKCISKALCGDNTIKECALYRCGM